MRRDAPRVGATIHECGHALYEQGRDVGAEGLGLPASRALSMGVHESQSLLWERMVLQSKPFWEFAAPLFHARFPFTAEATAADFFRTYNRVSPGCIRVEADEVTYPLHVILRYDIERALFRGEMEVAEVPSYWVRRMKEDLGVHVPDDARGCLQVGHERAREGLDGVGHPRASRPLSSPHLDCSRRLSSRLLSSRLLSSRLLSSRVTRLG